jgi:amino acid transporter
MSHRITSARCERPSRVGGLSQLPAADAAKVILAHGGAMIVIVISFVTMFSIMNALLITTPRILLGMGRAGLGIRRAGVVSASGTPRFALGLTSLAAALLIVTGTFEQILALGIVLFVFNYISAYAAVFILRRREPMLPRPYRAFGYPLSTAFVLLGSVLFLVAAVVGDRRSAIIVAGLFIASIPAYAFAVRSRTSAQSVSRSREADGHQRPQRVKTGTTVDPAAGGQHRPYARPACLPDSRRSRRPGVMTDVVHESSRRQHPSSLRLHARPGALGDK